SYCSRVRQGVHVERVNEERVIEDALDGGLLTSADLEQQQQEFAEIGPRLTAFVRSGVLSLAAVRRLMNQASASVVPAPSVPDAASQGAERFDLQERLG